MPTHVPLRMDMHPCIYLHTYTQTLLTYAVHTWHVSTHAHTDVYLCLYVHHHQLRLHNQTHQGIIIRIISNTINVTVNIISNIIIIIIIIVNNIIANMITNIIIIIIILSPLASLRAAYAQLMRCLCWSVCAAYARRMRRLLLCHARLRRGLCAACAA